MSTLTKTLIILLTFSTFFLCATVVNYVGVADNYQQKYEQIKSSKDSLGKKVTGLNKQYDETVTQSKQFEDRLNREIASLKVKITDIGSKLKSSEREKSLLLQKVNSWASITQNFSATTDKQGQLLKNTLEELNRVEAEQIIERKELNETSAAIVEKMAIIETLELHNRRLLEEKGELENKLDKFLQPFGKAPAVTLPVTLERGPARLARAPVRDIALKGLVTAVDLRNSMASISIGSADGVRAGMKFHVTRGDEFFCDILIIDVDAEEAVGVLELLQQAPRAGDNVSTNL